MKLSLKPTHLKRYKDIIYLLMKYSGIDNDGLPADAESIIWEQQIRQNQCDDLNAQEFVQDVTALGPTFVKAAKWLAVADVLPATFSEAINQVDLSTEVLDFYSISSLIEIELGSSLEELFSHVTHAPIASTLFAQTHRAQLPNGQQVVIKVEKPDVAERVYDDLDTLEEIVKFYNTFLKGDSKLDLGSALNDFRKSMLAELDYRQEAHNLHVLRSNLKDLDLIVIPEPIDEFTTSKVLTTTFVNGQSITSINPRKLLRSERSKLAAQYIYAYLSQMFIDGFVDAEPDAKEVLFTDTNQLGLLDMGVVIRLSKNEQERLLDILLAIMEARTERVIDLLIVSGTRTDKFNENAFRSTISDLVLTHKDNCSSPVPLGRILLGINQAALKNGLNLPSGVAILGNSFLTLDHVAKIIDPNFKTEVFIHHSLVEMTRGHMADSVSPSHLLHNALTAVGLLEELPGKVWRLLDAITNEDIKIKINAVDEKVLIRGFQKIANRITVGLVLAALIIGAAMLMRIETSFKIMGYPGLAMLCFFSAAAFGFILVIEVLVSDRN